LIKAETPHAPAQLHYWHRETRGATAEVDYLIEREGRVIPLEVKSGTQGAMQSIGLFLAGKSAPYGIRCSLENFSTLPSGIKPLKIFRFMPSGRFEDKG
jgi:hypothetical protein